MTKKKLLLYLSLAFIAGFIFAPNPRTVTVEKQVEIVKEVQIASDRESKWKELKQLDDEGFGLASSSMMVCSDFAKAVGEFDTQAMSEAGKKLPALSKKVGDLAEKRTLLLRSLGY